MKIVLIGDIYGKSGRRAVLDNMSALQEDHHPDFIIVNSDNAAHGNGITPKIANHFFDTGIDAITTGDHVWDRREIIPFIDKEQRLVRPLNAPEHTPGRGYALIEKNGLRLLVVHLAGQVTMSKAVENPFFSIDHFFRTVVPSLSYDALIIDFHAEATSEKNALGYYCDGQATAVIGTHTHMPTADARMLPGGTAYITDIGMTGDYQSIIGAAYPGPMQRFLEKNPKAHLEPAAGEGTLCGVCIETKENSHKAHSITPIRYGRPI